MYLSPPRMLLSVSGLLVLHLCHNQINQRWQADASTPVILQSTSDPQDRVLSVKSLSDAISGRNLSEVEANLKKLRTDKQSLRPFFNRIKNVGEFFYRQNLYPEALNWYKAAAAEGHSTSQVNVGYMVLNGQGVSPSDNEAAQWFRKAADQGDPWGQANLGYLYEYGRGGVPKSGEEAQKLYTLAADAGVEFARDRLRYLQEVDETPLTIAVKKGDLNAVRKSVDVNQQDRRGETPLLVAVRKTSVEMVKLLLDLGANPDQANKSGDFPLLVAVDLGNQDIVEDLVRGHANVNIADSKNNTPLSKAFSKQLPEIVSLLLEAGADVNKIAAHGGTAVHWAIPKSNTPRNALNLKKVLDAGAYLEVKEEHGFTPLLLSLDTSDLISTTELLIQRGADVNAKDMNGDTPLMVSAVGGKIAQIDLLLGHGARVNDSNKDGITPLMLAVQSRHEDVVRNLIKAGADIEAEDLEGHSAITRAVWMEISHILDALRAGVSSRKHFLDLVSRAKLERNILEATAENNLSKVRRLVAAGASLNARNDSGTGLLQMAVARGQLHLVQFFLEHGANPNAQDMRGLSVLMLASVTGTPDIVKLLIQAGAKIDQKDESGRTALLYSLAASSRIPLDNIVSMLLAAGADVNASDKNGIDGLALLCVTEQWELVLKLLSAGAKEKLSSCSLQASSALGTTADIESLIELGVDVNRRQKGTEVAALHIAATAGRADVVALLLKARANPNLLDSNGATPLIRAAEAGNIDVVRTLLEFKPDLNVAALSRDFHDRGTALHVAINSHRDDIAGLLIDEGANVDAVDARRETPLMSATLRRNIPVMKKLLDRGANVDLRDESLSTALMKAVVSQAIDQRLLTHPVESEAINVLIEAGSDLEATNYAGQTSAILSARGGDIQVLRLLVAAGADLSGDKGSSALLEASKEGALEVVRALLEKKAQLDRDDKASSFDVPRSSIIEASSIIGAKGDDIALALIAAGADVHYRDGNRRSPILVAALYGKKSVVEALLGAGASVDDENEEGRTPLLWAAEFGHPEVVQVLLAAAADVGHRDREGNTALLLAAGGARDNSDSMKMLLTHGANLAEVNHEGNTALHLAAGKGYEQNAIFLLSLGASPNTRNLSGRTPIFNATQARLNDYPVPSQGIKIIRALVARQADVNATDNQGLTALMEASKKGYSDVVKVLIQLGANVNVRGSLGTTALLEVLNAHDEERDSLDPIPRLTPRMQIEVAKQLINNGASVNIKTEDGVTPLMRTAFAGQTDLAKLLLASHSDVNAQNSDGWTALMFASAQGNSAIVEALLRAGSKTGLKNSSGTDALSLALSNGHSDAAQLLRRPRGH
jgi:ankyrin repeat protein